MLTKRHLYLMTCLLAVPVCLGAMAAGNGLGIEREPFGSMPDGRQVDLFTLSNTGGIQAGIISYGTILVSLSISDRNGRFDDIVLGFDDLDAYIQRNPLFGAVVGRYANRIANARFELDGRTVHLTANAGKNHIHGGGAKRFDKVVWNAYPFATDQEVGVRLTHFSFDGEEGFPGNLNCTVTYTLNNADELQIRYTAVTDKPTVINLTNHSYFNLAGAGHGDVLEHEVQINADWYTPAGQGLIPTGEIHSVADTPLDFRTARPIGERIDALTETRGYDHNYVLNGSYGSREHAATIRESTSGRVMEVWTTEPGMQFYTANGMRDVRGKDGRVYQRHAGFCTETQHFPDSPNKPHFPSTVLRPGQTFESTTVFKFRNE